MLTQFINNNIHIIELGNTAIDQRVLTEVLVNYFIKTLNFDY